MKRSACRQSGAGGAGAQMGDECRASSFREEPGAEVGPVVGHHRVHRHADRYTGPCLVLCRSRQIRSSVLASVRRGDSPRPRAAICQPRRAVLKPAPGATWRRCPAPAPSGGRPQPGGVPSATLLDPAAAARRESTVHQREHPHSTFLRAAQPHPRARRAATGPPSTPA